MSKESPGPGPGQVVENGHGRDDSAADPESSEKTEAEQEADRRWRAARDSVLAEQGLTNVDIDGSFKEKVPFVDKSWFDASIGTVIMLNALVIGLETDLRKGANKDLMVWKVLENIFTSVWVLEMLSKLYFKLLRYFRSGWNIMDCFLVFLSVWDTWVMPNLGGDGDGSLKSLSLLRLARMLRMLRLLRLIRLMRMFKELWLIVNGFVESLKTLSWVLLLLSIVLYVSGIFMTLTVGHSCTEEGAYQSWMDCYRMFGNVPYSMYTLFQVLTLESWSMAVARPVIEVQPGLLVFFVIFLFITTFGLLNIIVGVICENTMQAAQQNEELQNARRKRQQLAELDKLRQIFVSADEDGSQNIDRNEFVQMSALPEVKEAFDSMELPLDEPEVLFDILDEEAAGELQVDAFILGAMKMKGPPNSMDMKAMAVSVKGINSRFKRFEDEITALQQRVKTMLEEPAPPELVSDDPPLVSAGWSLRCHQCRQPVHMPSASPPDPLKPFAPDPAIPLTAQGSSTPKDQNILLTIRHETQKLVEQSLRVQRLLLQVTAQESDIATKTEPVLMRQSNLSQADVGGNNGSTTIRENGNLTNVGPAWCCASSNEALPAIVPG